ncbi:phage antirepressor KilAC domain-containing protein [Paenibacillus sp. FSL R5-0407]|uniref:phage antirepressor n=1 Tax=Paenibacillus sp. FSL R5-0407 TaxID=2975320 RepID=UPI0030F63916
MNKPQIFNHQLFGEIRAVELDGKPHFVGVDIARVLEYSNPSKAIIDHCKGVSKLGIPSSGGNQETNVIPEGDVYRLIVKAADQSRNPTIREKAEQFEKWLFDEVLPTIRQHGAYMTPAKIEEVLLNPDTIIDLAQRLKQSNEERAKLASKIESDRPKVLFADAVTASRTSILVGELAKIIKQNGVDIGQNRLFAWLRGNGFLISRKGTDYNMPTQRSMEMGLFEIKETTINHSDGHITVNKTPKVTGKGQMYFINKFKSTEMEAISNE